MTENLQDFFNLFNVGKLTQKAEHDRIERTCNTFGKIKKCTIKPYPVDDEYIPKISGDAHDGYQIQYRKGRDESYTEMESMLSRILFKSKTKKISNKIWAEGLDSLGLKEVESVQTYRNLCETAMELLETHRTESLYGKIYAGSQGHMKKWRKDGGEDYDVNGMTNPTDALAFSRYYRDDLVKKSKFNAMSKYLKMVEGGDADSTYFALKEFERKELLPFLNEIESKKPEPIPPPQDKSKGDEDDSDDNQDEDNDQDKDTADKEEKASDEYNKALEEYNDKIEQTKTDSVETVKDFKEINVDVRDYQEDISDNDFDEETSKTNALAEVEQIQDELSIVDTRPPAPEGIEMVEREPNEYQVNFKLSKAMSGVFRAIKEHKYKSLDDEGSDIETDEYIKRLMDKDHTEIFEEDSPRQDIEIMLSIDCSSSMAHNFEKVRELSATLFHSVKRFNDIKISGVAWAGFRDCNTTLIKKLDDTKFIGSYKHDGTPTAYAVKFCLDRLRKSKMKTKILFVITDGTPNDSGDLTRVRDMIDKFKGIKTFGLYIGHNDDGMKKMFGKRFYSCYTMNEAYQHLLRDFKQEVIGTLK